MRILLISTAYNGLTQRVHIELAALGHEVSIELAVNDGTMREAISLFQPELIICPFLRQRLPEDIINGHTCIIVHPGIQGDRGPSSLDWAIQEGEEEWGVTALRAAQEMDTGDIWSTTTFKTRCASKNSLYTVEVTEAAVKVVLETVARFQSGRFTPEPLDYARPGVRGRLRPLMRQEDRRIDWAADSTDAIVARINAADGSPGVLDSINGEAVFLYGAHREAALRGRPGVLVAKRHGAICRATVDGAVWITHLKRKGNGGQPPFKLPAAMVLGETAKALPESPIELLHRGGAATFREIWYEEKNQVGYLHFDFYNGAMSTGQCLRLREAFLEARRRPTKVIVLMGGRASWSNGIHLNLIEAAADPAEESWHNINAINDLIHAILTTESHLTVAAVHGNAGAGGVPFALACDKVYARSGSVFNPHYKSMGLYGSEYWTYSLPKRVGLDKAIELTESCQALGMQEACAIGLIDGIIPGCLGTFDVEIQGLAESMARYGAELRKKVAERRWDERNKPLAAYREEELARMRYNFQGLDPAYHLARRNFVHKIPAGETPLRLAQHRWLFCTRYYGRNVPGHDCNFMELAAREKAMVAR